MCRVLRQVGNGSVADGVNAAVCNPSVQNSVATVLGIPLQRLVEDLAQLPAGDNGGAQVDISKMYCHLVSDISAPVVAEEEFNEHRAIFNWCVLHPSCCIRESTFMHRGPCGCKCLCLDGWVCVAIKRSQDRFGAHGCTCHMVPL